MDMSCWTCGHYLIGGGCWKDGQMGEEGWKNVSPNDSCNSWVEEGTKGTVTDYSRQTDGTTWEENEYLKDDESNL
jgi:hypothetical protein